MSDFLLETYHLARRIVIALVGGTVVLIGVCMIVLPGPAIVVIPAGLAILGVEFAFARVWLRKVRETGSALWSRRGWFRSRAARSSAQRKQPGSDKRLVGALDPIAHRTIGLRSPQAGPRDRSVALRPNLPKR